MRTSKKLLSLFLSAVLCLSLLPTMAWAEVDVKEVNDATELQTAITNAGSENPVSIKLADDIALTGTVQVSPGAKVTINGQGRTITFDGTNGNDNAAFGHNESLFGLKDTTQLTITNTEFVSNKEGSNGYAVITGSGFTGKVTMQGCTFTNLYTAVYMQPNGVVGGQNTCADLSITGCKYNNTTWGYSVDTVTPDTVAVVRVEDFSGNNGLAEGHNFEIFSNETVALLYPNDMKVVPAQFTSLAAAVKAAVNGDTIVLLKDASGAGIGTFETPADGQCGVKDITIDLGGHTYTVTDPPVGSTNTKTQGFHFEQGSNITIKNGTLTSSGDAVKMLVQNYCNLTLEGVTLDGSNLPDSGRYVLSNNCGTTTIKDSTITAKNVDVAFDVYGGFQSYGDVTVTVSGESVINGTIEVARKSESQNKNKNTLNIEGGTINGNLAITENADTVVAITGGTFTDLADAVKYAADKATIKLADDVTLADTLAVNSGKTLTIDLNEKTLSGRVNVKHGNVTFTNGHIVGDQPLNAYGSSDTSATDYSVITITDSVVVNNKDDDKNSMVIFGETAGTNGYGAVLNINGTVYGTVFVSGNLGNNSGYTDEMTASNIVNVESGAEIYTTKDQGIAMNGAATVKVASGASVTGREAIGVKRGTLDIAGGNFNAVGKYVDPNTENSNGTDESGAVIAVTDTYAKFGKINVSIKGGTFVEETDASAIYVESGTYTVSDPSISVTGGTFSSNPNAYVASSYAATEIAGSKYIVGKDVTVDGNKKVTGGTFDFDPSAYLASGYRCTDSNGKYVVSAIPSSGGGGGSSSTTKTETTTNADGSKTTTTTDTKTGTVTETTTKTETAANGTKTETKVEVVTQKDGTVTEKQTETATAKNGTTATKVETTDAAGKTETKVEAKVTAAAVTEAKTADKPVTIPVTVESTKSAETAATVSVSVPKSAGSTKVEVPVTNVTAGTVAVLVKADGTEEIIKTSVLTEDGVALKVEGDVQIKIIDNTKEFTDVVDNHWAGDAIDFATSHEIFNGTGDKSFAPEATMTRAMLFTVLARFDDAPVVTTGENWYADSMEWAKTNGVSDGTNPEGSISREQLATMLYRYAGAPAVTGDLAAFGDAATVSDYAAAAMQWAVSAGLINGIDGKLAPQGLATRAQLAAIMQRFCTNVVF